MEATVNSLNELWESDPHKWAVTLMAPYIMGFVTDVFLYGVLFGQVSHYFSLYNDKLALRLIVALLFLLHTLKSVLSIASIWSQAINSYPDITKALDLIFLNPLWLGMPLMGAILDSYVQAFFCRRLIIVSNRNMFVSTPIIIVFIFALVACVIGSVLMMQGNLKFGWWIQAHVVSTLVGDILLTSSTAYFLIKTKKNVLPQTAGLLNALVRLTFQTALPATICALLSVSFTAANNFTQVTCNFALPKLYAIAMMWTLNARQSIGVAGESTSQSVRRRIDNLELGTFSSQVQIHTRSEFLQHIDYPDSNDKPTKAGIDPETSGEAATGILWQVEKRGTVVV